MSTAFSLALLAPHPGDWPARLEAAGVRLTGELSEAEAVYGGLSEDDLAVATRLRWLQAPQAGPPPGFYHRALIEHPVVVTNMRDTYTDHVATHTMALVLALCREIPRYARATSWQPDWDPSSVVPLGERTALVVGVGALGTEIGRLLSAFGTRVTGVDARRTGGPPAGFARLGPPEELDDLLPHADLVIVTVPHTPATEGLFDARRFALMRAGALFVNVGRGPTVRLDALVDALDSGRLRAAALDVFETEPLPDGHPLWSRALITPHVAGAGPHADERRFAVLLENCRRFAAGLPLMNVVDKDRWH
ncbi:MAG: D-2-hydroxyacid dehydrogenase [Thermoactinospora sp.]|nr:D-2-hydroxyacid dehydrogenase [Thermoactinospora sp.]